MIRPTLLVLLLFGFHVLVSVPCLADEPLKLLFRSVSETGKNELRREMVQKEWSPAETAVIVCDVWDYHHSINAVNRLDQFAPRLNELLIKAREMGATIVHSPSDCMEAYANHPSRIRAIESFKRHHSDIPKETANWCSKLASEQNAIYPIDQSDGGEDDNRNEHKDWAEKLKALDRNPSMPWKMQNAKIEIDQEKDFLSDKGDEVWAVLRDKQIKNVILTGVHTNMCVTGRPFGIRRMVQNGFEVALVRDLTDCMYNPIQWPYIDHFTGNDLFISYVEQFLCPTITSDQFLGGTPFQFKEDKRTDRDILAMSITQEVRADDFIVRWVPVNLPGSWEAITNKAYREYKKPAWYRCAVGLSESEGELELELPAGCNGMNTKAWLNGKPISLPIQKTQVSTAGGEKRWTVPNDAIQKHEANLLVLRIDHRYVPALNEAPAVVLIGANDKASRTELSGTWQIRLGDDPTWSNIPLPAKFGISPAIYHALK